MALDQINMTTDIRAIMFSNLETIFFYKKVKSFRALKGLVATNISHFGTANFPANIASEKLKTSV